MGTEQYGVILTKEQKKYFDSLEKEYNIILTDGQKAWYVKKSHTQGDYMKREYPSTAEEAFESSNEGFYFAKQMSQARQEHRICHLPPSEHAKTYSAADIGIGDNCAIWVYQLAGKEIHLIDYYESVDEPSSHYIKWLKTRPYVIDKHILPHDAKAREKGSGKCYADYFIEAGLKVDVLARDQNEMFGIECLRNTLNRMFFDQAKCAVGIKAVEAFRKEWNDKMGCYREKSMHNWASHGTKALIYAAESIAKLTNGQGMSAELWAQLRREYL